MQTFFFYDLETSGLNPRQDRIMQFAGQRTDMNLKPIGEPYNVLVKLNDDTLPSPEAVMVTGITPQSTLSDGLTEAEFARMLVADVFTPGTITVGFNNIRFDDEFIRYLFWRTFNDPYEWSWSEGRSRWDLLDVVRMTRALRPSGIEWPTTPDGTATNRLELLTKVNGLSHEKAHDALSDVEALIDVTKLIKSKQPKLYDFLLAYRDKKKVQQLVNLNDKAPFVYVSGRYEPEYEKATVAFPLTSAPHNNVVAFDLRYDPTPFLDWTEDQLQQAISASWKDRQAGDYVKVPTKILQYNRTPAVAPLGVLAEADGWKRISLDLQTVEAHTKTLLLRPDFAEKIRSVYETARDWGRDSDPEAALYDGFVDNTDRLRIEAVRNASEVQLTDFHPEFRDERLPSLLMHYKARSFARSLSEDETRQWETWRANHLQQQLPAFVQSLQKIANDTTSEQKQFLLQELQLWAEGILPVQETDA